MAQIRIDFVSDVSCPWCAVGLKSLQAALARVAPDIIPELHFQPFELNPGLPAQGVDFAAHMAQKYNPKDITRSQEALAARGAALGFHFNFEQRTRIYNTFDAHRLLHWADTQGHQLPLKLALFQACFTDGRDISDLGVLAQIAAGAGLDADRARRMLQSGEFTTEVREREQYYTSRGIHAVPSVIFNGRQLVQGGQPPEAFEQVLRQLAAAPATAA